MSSSSTTARCSSGSEGPGTSSSAKARSTKTMASTSRMWLRNLLPSPSPLLAPATSPPMSTNCTVAGTTFLLLLISASASRRGSGTRAMPTLGSVVAKAYGRGQGATAREGVVQRRLACVGETDEPEPLHGRQGTGPTRCRPNPATSHAPRALGSVTRWLPREPCRPADALDRVVYLLDRDLAEGRRVAAYAKARDLARELGDDEVGPAAPGRRAARPAGDRQVHRQRHRVGRRRRHRRAPGGPRGRDGDRRG